MARAVRKSTESQNSCTRRSQRVKHPHANSLVKEVKKPTMPVKSTVQELIKFSPFEALFIGRSSSISSKRPKQSKVKQKIDSVHHFNLKELFDVYNKPNKMKRLKQKTVTKKKLASKTKLESKIQKKKRNERNKENWADIASVKPSRSKSKNVDKVYNVRGVKRKRSPLRCRPRKCDTDGKPHETKLALLGCSVVLTDIKASASNHWGNPKPCEDVKDEWGVVRWMSDGHVNGMLFEQVAESYYSKQQRNCRWRLLNEKGCSESTTLTDILNFYFHLHNSEPNIKLNDFRPTGRESKLVNKNCNNPCKRRESVDDLRRVVQTECSSPPAFTNKNLTTNKALLFARKKCTGHHQKSIKRLFCGNLVHLVKCSM